MANGNNRVGVRDFLKSQGFRDEDIGWDNKTKTVTLQGQQFYTPSTIENNRAFANREALQEALKMYRQRNQQTQANQTTNQTPNYENQINTFVEQLIQKAQAQPQPFSYDPQSDPSYQAALERIRQNIQREQANTNAFLRARGQGRSSYSETVANQIAANAMSQLENEIVPALVQEAYQRYRDQIADQQNMFTNLNTVVGTLADLRSRRLTDELTRAQIEGANIANQMNQQYLAALPEEIQLNFAKLRNDVEKGNIDVQTAKYQLDQTLDPNSIPNKIAKLELETAEINRDIAALERMYLPERQKLQLQEMKKRISMIGADTRTPEQIERDRIQLEIMKQELENMKKPQTPQVGMTPEEFRTELAAMTEELRSKKANGTLNIDNEIQRIEEDRQLGFYTPEQAELLKNAAYLIAGTRGTENLPLDITGIKLPPLNMTVTESVFGR